MFSARSLQRDEQRLRATGRREEATAATTERKRLPRRRTSHLKDAPGHRSVREAIRQRCRETSRGMDRARPLSKDEMEATARHILAQLGEPEIYVGWTMVAMASAFWHDQVAAVPPNRRLLLLPHCLKHAEGCPADYDQFGLDCKRCGACSIADFRVLAEEMGYKVLVAEGSPIVMKIIIGGYVDAVVGVACLNVLERAIDKILLAGVPCMAVPLLSNDCRNTSVDEDWVEEMIRLRRVAGPARTRTYLHLMRAADQLFQGKTLERLAPRLRRASGYAASPQQDPLAGTEQLAYDFLARGGKHSRPFITLATYDAVTGGKGTLAGGPEYLSALPDAIHRTALSIEIFHKASLVHDDIEDDDAFRYGDATLHRQYGVPTAINVGDYLIGMGYRMVSRETELLGADVVADILDHLADAHMRLAEGQGAELFWREASDKTITPVDALRIYALKTAPAFEVALYAGLRLAGSVTPYAEMIRQLAKHLGIAFQILNDLEDWEADDGNKRTVGQDVLQRRPTVLWALATETLSPEEGRELEELVAAGNAPETTMQRVRQLYLSSGVFEMAHRLVDKYQQRAETVIEDLRPDELRRFLHYLIDSVLER
ncbi:MAG: polyprenyl synthetase family protein, partial [Pirellulales bacterium]